MQGILIGFLFSGLISMAALIKKSLSISGAFAATILGTAIFYFGGVYLSAIMIAFFASSSILTRFKKHRKIFTYDIHEKSGGRDYAQVLANGGAGFIAVIFFIGYVLKFGFNIQAIVFSMIVAILGFAGCIIDSLLGATIQAKYCCEICGKITEKKIHHERSTKLVTGLKYINNDTVNFISILSVAIIVIFLF
jgi:uncharacterized membrane protein